MGAISERDSNMFRKWGARSKKRILKWAQRNTPGSEEMSKRTFAVKQMYPQVFYAFSDVVVFVLTQPKTLEVVVEDLLAWADKNCKGSINLPSKPHVVIAINKCEPATPAHQWSPANATATLLSAANSQIRKNVTFAKYANHWENSGVEIDDMRELLRRYYSSVNVVRIPQKSRYQLLNEQRDRLYDLILDNCNRSSETKGQKRMLPDVDEFGDFLSLAFDHFAESLDTPFDFIKASLQSNPPPRSFAGNIHKFIMLMDRKRHGDEKVDSLFSSATPMIATCILLDSSRNRRMGSPSVWFKADSKNGKSYESICEDLVKDYFNMHVRCTFEIRDGLRRYHRCDLRRVHHGLLHFHYGKGIQYQYKGEFESDFNPKDFAWSKRVVHAIEQLQVGVAKRDLHNANRHGWIKGHRDGGVRGIVELRVLEAIENELHVPLQRFFDLIVGTSTGGIIALAIGDQCMSIQDGIVAFGALVQDAFTPRNRQKMLFFRQVQKYVKRSMYETRPLEAALKRVFKPEQPLFGMRDASSAERLNVAVTAATGTGGHGYILSNYNTSISPRIDRCQRYRPDSSEDELKVWEAARSTSAAIGFFKPYKRDPRRFQPPEFTDGGLFQNNPIQIAIEESRSLAKTRNQVPTPDILLSVGTGLPESYATRGKELREYPFEAPSSEVAWFRVLFSVVAFQLKINLDAEKRWHEQVETEPDLRSRMFRINPYLGKEPPEMDDKDCVPELSKTLAHDLLNKHELRESVRKVASVLAASSFYFKLRHVLSGRTGIVRLSGTIKCRLSRKEIDVKGLGQFLSGCNCSFLIQSTPQYGKDQELKIPVQAMVEHGSFPGLDVDIEILGEEVESKISLKLPGMTSTGQLYAISGFPRCLFRDDAANLARHSYDKSQANSARSEGSSSRHGSKSSLPPFEKLDLDDMETTKEPLSETSSKEEMSRNDSMSTADYRSARDSMISGTSGRDW